MQIKKQLEESNIYRTVSYNYNITVKKIIANYKQLKIHNDNYEFLYITLVLNFHKIPIVLRLLLLDVKYMLLKLVLFSFII